MTFIVDGTNGLTFPNSTVQASSGVVLQVIQNSTSAAITTTSDSFVTTNFSVSITPKFSSSKVLILVSGGGWNVPSTYSSYATIYRASTNLGDATYGLERIYSSASIAISPHSMCILDSPATTSSTAYTCFFRSSSAGTTVEFSNTNRGIVTITVMEIAA